jgi:hypothetical protein
VSRSEPDQVARAILSYFLRNPQAADNLEGIVRWRLLSETVHRKVDETRAALAWLTDNGYLTQAVQLSSDPIFMLNPEKREQAEELLTEDKT